MTPKQFFGILISAGIIVACNSGSDKTADSNTTSTENTTTSDNTAGTSTEASNPKGVGKHTNVTLTHPLDEKMVAGGKSVYDVKCSSCHKTTDEKLVGPGWKGVTDRRTPEWIMNFVTNTEEML